jgi:hypothetical protein
VTTRQRSRQAIFDALAIRGPTAAGGFITTADPLTYLSGQRLDLAQEALRFLPTGARMLDADRLAIEFEARIDARSGDTAGGSPQATR